MNKKLIIGIIIGGIIFGSIGVYAGSNFYANGISVNAPIGSSLGSDATLQSSLDELYSIADKYDELKTEINSLKNNTLTLDKIYPVGSVYISTSITSASDVASKLGGTWEVYGSGRTLVGVNTSDTNFNTVSKTGGSSTTTLSTSNLPSHNHSIPALSGTATQTGSGYSIGYTSTSRTTSTNGNHSHYVYAPSSSTGGNIWNNTSWATPTSSGQITSNPIATTNTAGNHTHTVTDTYANSISGVASHSHTVTTTASTTGSTGSGTAFSNLQPYITVYMYKRTK